MRSNQQSSRKIFQCTMFLLFFFFFSFLRLKKKRIPANNALADKFKRVVISRIQFSFLFFYFFKLVLCYFGGTLVG